jgi:ATP synthase protein I
MKEIPGRGWGEASTLAFTLVGYVVIFMGLGYLVDRWVHTRPWFMVGGVLVGAGLGFIYLVSMLFSGNDRRSDGDEGDGEGRGPEAG